MTPANTHDLDAVPELLHGREDAIWGDAGYRDIEARVEHQKREANFHIAERPSKCREMPEGSAAAIYEKSKASMRAKVEHLFLWIKRHFGYSKVRYRGLAM